MTRLPLTVWAFLVTAIIGVVSFPVLLSAALLLIMDRSFGTSFFLSDIFYSRLKSFIIKVDHQFF
jgi:cytochrome c oxidase subunit 1